MGVEGEEGEGDYNDKRRDPAHHRRGNNEEQLISMIFHNSVNQTDSKKY